MLPSTLAGHLAYFLYLISLVPSAEGSALRSNLMERAYPQSGSFQQKPQQLSRIHTSIKDAVTLAHTVLRAPHLNDIYPKYFKPGADTEKVLQVFRNIVAGDTDGTGARIIEQLTVQDGTVHDPEGHCKDTREVVDAYVVQGDPQHPQIIYCESYFKERDLSQITCPNLGAVMTAYMDGIGSITLHELTHWDRIGASAVGTRIEDRKYGPYKCQRLRRNRPDVALINADSYTYYALEVYYTEKCKRDFYDPDRESDSDESVSAGSCQSGKDHRPGPCRVQ